MNKDCQICQGTGWVVKKKGKTEYAKKCQCQSADIFLLKSENANIPPRFRSHELKAYFPNNANPSQKKAKKIVEKFIEDYPAVGGKGLLLQGYTGVGKTRLLCSIATELIMKIKELDIYYIDWNDLVREMRSGEDFSTRNFSQINQLINKLSRVDLLLFDEIGASKVSPWVHDNIYFLFNQRYNNERLTVCATNYFDKSADGKESLTQRIGERIRSRLFEMTRIVEIGGSDYRQEYE